MRLKPRLLIGDVAAALGLSVDYVRSLDQELKPERKPNGYRAYDPDVVEEVIAKRSAR